MKLCAFTVILAVLLNTFHRCDMVIEGLSNWENLNSILSKSDRQSINKIEKNERTFKGDSEIGDKSGKSEHINENYLFINTDENGSFTEPGSSTETGYDATFHPYSSKIENNITKDQSLVDDIEQQIKNLVGAEDIAAPFERQSRRNKPSKYIKELFTAMLNSDSQTPDVTEPGAAIPVPTIRSYRGIRVHNPGQHGQAFHFDINEEQSSDYTRVELVIDKTSEAYQTYQLSISVISDGRIEELQETTSYEYESYLIFDLTSIAPKLDKKLEFILRLSSAGEHPRIRRRDSPLLVVYENMAANPLFDDMTSVGRKKRNYKSYIIDDVHPTDGDIMDDFNCKSYSWDIDIAVFQWSWYIAPRFYNAGFCSGDCPFPLDSPVMNSTTYALIKNLFHYQTGFLSEYLPRACCTPVSYFSQSILYFDRGLNVVTKRLPNMRVAGCGCR